jgi:hypothetical protein
MFAGVSVFGPVKHNQIHAKDESDVLALIPNFGSVAVVKDIWLVKNKQWTPLIFTFSRLP